eukprot:GHVH01017017.1.p1 GENE.GHVH01017017.1~~GHVH01017017.1.p1  ORF type:complete len:763 (+),score=82.94 GHVH01017017.1:201-2489(+)
MRIIHKRLIFLTCSLFLTVVAIFISAYLIPLLRSLGRVPIITPEEIRVEPVAIDAFYERDCQIKRDVAITGYVVQAPIITDSIDQCRSECLAFNDQHLSETDRCDFISFHSPSAVARAQAGLDPSDYSQFEDEVLCHFVSGLSTIHRTFVVGAASAVVECLFPISCLLKMRGTVRSGDVSEFRVFEPVECEQKCQGSSPLDCLYWTLYASGTTDGNDLELMDTCVLHRATKPVSSPMANSKADSWPVQITRAQVGTSLVGGRICPRSADLDLLFLQDEVYQLYGMEPPNRQVEVVTDTDKFAPGKEQLEEWFYDNNEFDGGPFPVDPVPLLTGAITGTNSSCPYGLTNVFRDETLVKFLGGDEKLTIQTENSVILTPNAAGQGHLTQGAEDSEANTLKIPDLLKVGLAADGESLVFNDALWVISLKHMPIGCGVHRSITLRSPGNQSSVRVLDSMNYKNFFTMGLETTNECDMSLPYLMNGLWHPFLKPHQRGAWARLIKSDESSRELWNCKTPGACQVESRIWRNGIPEPIFGGGGIDFNSRGGGVLVIQVDRSRAIKIWNFSPEDVPNDLMINAPDPSSWALRPTRTVSGEEKYLTPMAMFPFARGCESMAGCAESDVLRCPNLLDTCPDSMKTLHKSTVFSVDSKGNDVSNEKTINAYFPIGCHGFKNFQDLSLEFGLSFCDNASSADWQRDPLCSLINPIDQVEADGPTLIDQCNSAQKDAWDTLLLDAFWELYEVRVYERGSSACYHENVIRVTTVG